MLSVHLHNTCDVSFWDLFAAGDTFPNKAHWWGDVRDVAMAHIQAYELPMARGRYCLVGSELPMARGRYCLVGSILHCSETMKILQKLYPALNLPEK